MNTPESIKMGKSRVLAARLMFHSLSLLNKQDSGSMPFSTLKQQLSETLDFDEWETYIYPNSGQVRWIVNLQYYSIDLAKAGLLLKNKGEWCITDDGRQALVDYDEPNKLFKYVHKLYAEWVKNNKDGKDDEIVVDDVPNSVILENIRQQSNEDLRNFIEQRTPYEFQDMVAALLRSMNYYTPFVAPKGKDGGVDVIAYSDPLGATRPILKVQVKHYKMSNPVTIDVIHNIIGVAKSDMPIVVTSGRFTEDARTAARQNNVRLIDGTEFVQLWIANYSKMNEDDKALMPIEPVYFVKRD
ncbi:MAG: restriction endonuclease [Paludibacteraceae bacterium]|nr:restriction endonuclease [Paludibacteraceae bacterium]